jgi:hypothetical protein
MNRIVTLCMLRQILHYLSDQLKRDKLAGDVARMGDMIYACRFIIGKPEGKRSLGRTRHRWF